MTSLQEKQQKLKEDLEYLKLHPFCKVKNQLGCTYHEKGNASEVLEVHTPNRIFKSVICDFHAYKFLMYDNKDILILIDKKEIEGEWVNVNN